ncbi:MAG: glycine/betaine ABC transporter substrate-binding protein, partial [Pseudomonadota bacterium]
VFALTRNFIGKDPADVAKEWVAANSDRVDAWLGL